MLFKIFSRDWSDGNGWKRRVVRRQARHHAVQGRVVVAAAEGKRESGGILLHAILIAYKAAHCQAVIDIHDI
jgi:hypothetical protein